MWFYTWTGKKFRIRDPDPDSVDITDIAHSLAHQCRFYGHVSQFYSVAQHSILVSGLVPHNLALEGLLHDATEAYVGDVIRPIKLALPGYRDIERGVRGAIAHRFGLQTRIPQAVKDADGAILLAERRALQPAAEAQSKVEGGWPEDDVYDAPRVEFDFMTPEIAERRFVQRWKDLR